MKRFCYIFITILLCAISGCTRYETMCNLPAQGSLTVTLNATSATRATVPGDGDIYSGGGMEDLTLVLVNSMGNVSEIQRLQSLVGDEQRIKSVTFVNLDVGNYVLYAYANVERSLLDEVKGQLLSLKTGDVFNSSYYDALFTMLSDRETPIIDDLHPLLLTASKSVTVGVENSSVSIDLLRPVVWFEVRLYNHSDFPMQVDDISFSNFNPSTSYVLPKDGAIPSSVSYRGLPLYDTYSGGSDIVVPTASESTIYETALFENRAPSYTMNITLKAGNSELQNVSSISSVANAYALKNRSTGRYLVDNGSGTMALVSTISAAKSVEHALWIFSSTSAGYMTNVATGKRYYRDTTSATSGSNLTFAIASGYFRMSYRSGVRSYYLRDNNGTPNFANVSTQARDWQLQQSVQRSASINNSQINVVDMNTAAVVPMTEQLRNQHVKIVINAYYNDTDGEFNFVVLPWVEKNEEVEFN